MKRTAILLMAYLFTCTMSGYSQASDEISPTPSQEIMDLALTPGEPGGAPYPSAEELQSMQSSWYILHARGGELTKVKVDKFRLPRDPQGHAQGMRISKDGTGKLYVSTSSMLYTSTDGGRKWQAQKMSNPEEHTLWVARPDGALIAVTMLNTYDAAVRVTGPGTVWISEDGGKTHRKLTEFSLDLAGTPHENYRERYAHSGINVLADGTLMFGLDARTSNEVGRNGKLVVESGSVANYFWFSRDGGETWTGPSHPVDWATEGGAVLLPSGKLFASFRHQRPMLETDPPNVHEISRSDSSYVWKHVFTSVSEDGGMTWSPLRRLTTHFGQCYGWPAALSDGTLVVAHDTRYGPGPQSGRAVVSFDEGHTWEDEIYYLYYGRKVSGYNNSVVLDDDTIVTVFGTCDAPGSDNAWNAMVGNTDHTVIRWKPVRD